MSEITKDNPHRETFIAYSVAYYVEDYKASGKAGATRAEVSVRGGWSGLCFNLPDEVWEMRRLIGMLEQAAEDGANHARKQIRDALNASGLKSEIVA